MRIAFVDPWPPQPYSFATLKAGPTGGTTADVILLAEALARRHEVRVFQDPPPDSPEGAAKYLPTSAAVDFVPDAVVYLRAHTPIRRGHLSAPSMREKNPDVRLFYWPHVTLPQPFSTWWGRLYGLTRRSHVNRFGKVLEENRVEVVAVSQWHAENVSRAWPRLRVHWIYNPVELRQGGGPAPAYDPYKLVYASSPERGLNRAVSIVKKLRRTGKPYRLYVATPGYPAARSIERVVSLRFDNGVRHLGHLPRAELFPHIQTALCLLQPNRVFEESFGRVFAEAHNLGTPVLTGGVGAAPETVGDKSQVVDGASIRPFVDRILEWSGGRRPIVAPRGEFAPDRIAEEWEQLFGYTE